MLTPVDHNCAVMLTHPIIIRLDIYVQELLFYMKPLKLQGMLYSTKNFGNRILGGIFGG